MNLSMRTVGIAATLTLLPSSGVMALGTGLPVAMGLSAGLLLGVTGAAFLVVRSLQATLSEPFESSPD